MTNDNKKTILYYPTIKIEDGIWLRNAILYWDKVASIVPGMDFNEFNSIEVEYLQDAGIYEPIYPFELQDNQRIYDEFCKHVTQNLKYHRGRARDINSTRVHIDKLNMESRVHIDKTPDRVLDFLLEKGIARRTREEVWINMNSKDAEIYMATLAKYLAKIHGNTGIGTDKGNKIFYPYSKGNKDVEKQYYLNIALQQILPVPYMNVPLSDIIDFRKRYEKELKCFRLRIEEFEWSLKQCECVEDIKERTRLLRHQIDYDLDEIEDLMNRRGIRSVKRTIRTLIPTGIGTGVEAWAGNVGVPPVLSALIGEAANLAAGATISAFCADESLQLKNSSAYLFYARENGLIFSNR